MRQSLVGVLGALIWLLTGPAAAYAVSPPSSSHAVSPEAKIEVYFIGPKLFLGDNEAAPRRFAQRIRIQEGQATGAMNYEGGNPEKGTPPDLEMGGKIKVLKVAPANYPVRISVDITFESRHEKRRERFQQELDILNPLELVYLKNQNGVGTALLRWEENKNNARTLHDDLDVDSLEANIRGACICPFGTNEGKHFYVNYAEDGNIGPVKKWLTIGRIAFDGHPLTSSARKPANGADGSEKTEWLASMTTRSFSKKPPLAVDMTLELSGPGFETMTFHETITVERIPAWFMLRSKERGYVAIIEVSRPKK